MKNITSKIYLVFLLSMICVGISCKKEKEGVEALPKETQEGKNKIGCLVNGKVLLPRKEAISTVRLFNAYYYPLDGKFYFHISMVDSKHPGLRSLVFNSVGDEISEGTYDLTSDEAIGISVIYTSTDNHGNSTKYTIRGNNTGRMVITKLDLVNMILSGTFSFDAESEDGQKIQVREGRFDMKI